MKGYGTCTLVFGHRNLLTQDRIKYLKDNGIEYIEISALQSLHFNIYNKEHIQNISKAVKKYNLKVWSIHAPFCPIAMLDEPSRIEGIKIMIKTYELRKYFNFNLIVMHPGSDDPKGNREKELKNLKKSLKEIVNRTGRIKIALETMGDFPTSEKLLEVIEDFDREKVGVCIDTGHINQFEDVPSVIKKFKDRIFSVHIHDNNGKKDEHLLPFSGNIDWRRVYSALIYSGYTGVFMYEVCNPNLNVKENLKRMQFIYNKLQK